MISGLAVLALAIGGTMVASPVDIQIQVIEAQEKGGNVEPRLRELHAKAFKQYQGARIVDEVQTKVEEGSSVSLEILKKSQVLRVTVQKVEPDGTIKLRVAIDAFKFSADTTHKKDKATVVVGHETGKNSAILLAVSPRATGGS